MGYLYSIVMSPLEETLVNQFVPYMCCLASLQSLFAKGTLNPSASQGTTWMFS